MTTALELRESDIRFTMPNQSQWTIVRARRDTTTVNEGVVVIHDTSTSMSIAPPSTPEELLAELVRDHLDAVYRVAYSVVRDSALAEDVSQDAILKAWKALPTFRGDSSLRSWVLRITHNTAISTLRKRREELRDPDLLPERDNGTSTEQQVVGRLSVDAFENALNQLDELSRSIVVLREIEGFSYDEIADMLDVPLPTVKTRLLRSRRVLAAALEEWRP
jgi:RNA polymerase sigma-70 factor (ECF subfamily)